MAESREWRARALRRAERLEALRIPDRRKAVVDEDVAANRRRWWEGRRPAVISVRTDLIRNTGTSSPFHDLEGRRGVTQQLLLLLIFMAQCRPTPARGGVPAFMLGMRDSTELSAPPWRGLIAASTFNNTGERATEPLPT